MKKKTTDTAWGFFYSPVRLEVEFYSGLTELPVKAAQKEARRLGWKPSPVFRITAPKKSTARKGRHA